MSNAFLNIKEAAYKEQLHCDERGLEDQIGRSYGVLLLLRPTGKAF